MAAAHIYELICTVMLVMLTLSDVCSAQPNECSQAWHRVADKDYCFGSTDMTFDDSRSYCQSLDSDLPVLNSSKDYTNLLQVLTEYSQKFSGSVDTFLGVYQRECVVDVESGCNWLSPFSGQWFWINTAGQHVTNQSDTFWQILEFQYPLITNFDSINNIAVQNNQHVTFGSDNSTALVDGFKSGDEFLYKTYPLCVRVSGTVSDGRQVSSNTAADCRHMNIEITTLTLISVLSVTNRL